MIERPRPRPNFLRVVDAAPVEQLTKDAFTRPAWQNTLFANANPSLIVFVDCDHVTDQELITTLIGSHPKLIFDVRRVPRFDMGRFSRREAFRIFREVGSQYVDLSSIHRQNRPEPSPEAIGNSIQDSRHAAQKGGPIAVLVENSQFSEEYISTLLAALPPEGQGPWDVFRVPFRPASPSSNSERDVVFISHANPKDNEFSVWLAQQLTLCGYSVWCDVRDLSAGDKFWDDIEDCIRSRCAKFIVVLTRTSQTASGVLDEIDLAIRVERSQQLVRFVLPVRLDDLPFSEVRANLGRKNIIDFHKNWAAGLKSILDVFDRDRVPRADIPYPNALHFGTPRSKSAMLVFERPELLTSNWLPIRELPPFVYFYDVAAPMEQIDGIASSLNTPTFKHLRLIGSFSDLNRRETGMKTGVLTERYRIAFSNFLDGNDKGGPHIKPRDAHNLSISMLRQAWNAEMDSRGLKSFTLASNSVAWYMPIDLVERNTVTFLDADQKKRRKTMVNWSERRKVFWHFAVEARPVLGSEPRYVLRQHVIFTADGRTPLVSKERMHVLRRRFCKSWWNDRWRDLLVAFVAWLDPASNRAFGVAGVHVQLDNSLLQFVSPLSLERSTVDSDAEMTDLDDEELSEAADDFDEDFDPTLDAQEAADT